MQSNDPEMKKLRKTQLEEIVILCRMNKQKMDSVKAGVENSFGGSVELSITRSHPSTIKD